MKLSTFSEKRLDIFSLHGKTERDIADDIGILKEWMLKVPHLPLDEIEDEFLEICLLNNKFSIEKCKSKIEAYFTLKGDPHYHYLYEELPISCKRGYHIPLPVLTDNFKRVLISKVDEDAYDMTATSSTYATMKELLVRHDYNDGEIHIIDMRDCSIGIISKLRLNVANDIFYLVMKAATSRITEIHVISKLSKALVPVFNSFVPKKFADRMHYHEDEESLKRVVPAKYLPKDLGGDLQSVKDLYAELDDLLEENQEYIMSLIKKKSREELRQNGSKGEILQGTFKKLNID